MRRQLQIISIILASTSNYAGPVLGFSSTVLTVRPSSDSVDQPRRCCRRRSHGRRQKLQLHAINDQKRNEDISISSDTSDVKLDSRWEDAAQKLPNALCSVMLAIAVASTPLGSETPAFAAAA